MTANGAAPKVVVIGGGVTGLTTAYRLTKADPTIGVTVLEANERPGGKLRSVQVGDLLLPSGADSFLARKPWAVQLCKELGIGGELVAPGATGAHLWTERGLVAMPKQAPFGIPGDIGQVFSWPGLSRAGRRRAALDLLKKKRKDDSDETLGSLLRRRLGDEATDRAVAPLLAGLYAGDIDRLSVRATFPDLERWEAWQGSLIRGAQAANRQSREVRSGPDVRAAPRRRRPADRCARRRAGVPCPNSLRGIRDRSGRWTSPGHARRRDHDRRRCRDRERAGA